MIDHKYNIKGLDSQVCLMCHAMNTSHEWNKLGLKLGSNICATTLEYNNTISTKRHEFFGNEIKVWNTSINNNCLCNDCSQVSYIKAINYMFQRQ